MKVRSPDVTVVVRYFDSRPRRPVSSNVLLMVRKEGTRRQRFGSWTLAKGEKLMPANQVLDTRRKMVERFTKRFGSEHLQTMAAAERLAEALHDANQSEEGLELQRFALAVRSDQEPGGRDTVISEYGLAVSLCKLERWEEGEPHLAHVVSLRHLLLDEGPVNPVEPLIWWGLAKQHIGDLEGAVGALREALVGVRSSGGEDGVETTKVEALLADALAEHGDLDEACALLRHVVGARGRNLGQDDAHTLDAMNNLAIYLMRQSHYNEAQVVAQSLVERRTATLGPQHPATINAIRVLGWARSRQAPR